MSTPTEDARDLIARGDVQIVAEYITKARQNERFAKFFEWIMFNDMSAEYDVHTHDMLNDPRYDKTYLCVYIETAMRIAAESSPRTTAEPTK